MISRVTSFSTFDGHALRVASKCEGFASSPDDVGDDSNHLYLWRLTVGYFGLRTHPSLITRNLDGSYWTKFTTMYKCHSLLKMS